MCKTTANHRGVNNKIKCTVSHEINNGNKTKIERMVDGTSKKRTRTGGNCSMQKGEGRENKTVKIPYGK